MKEIKLFNTELVGLVDDADFEVVRHFRYHLMNGYPHRHIIGSTRGQFLHNDVIPWSSSFQLHHVDGNKRNAQRNNLIKVTLIEHNQLRRKSKSGFIGVYQSRGRWVAQVRLGNFLHHGGYYKTAERAALARDALATVLFGQQAVLNFPVQVALPNSDDRIVQSIQKLNNERQQNK